MIAMPRHQIRKLSLCRALWLWELLWYESPLPRRVFRQIHDMEHEEILYWLNKHDIHITFPESRNENEVMEMKVWLREEGQRPEDAELLGRWFLEVEKGPGPGYSHVGHERCTPLPSDEKLNVDRHTIEPGADS